jgi:hypothetical protein
MGSHSNIPTTSSAFVQEGVGVVARSTFADGANSTRKEVVQNDTMQVSGEVSVKMMCHNCTVKTL